MAYGLPARGQHDWDDELNNSIESLHSDVQSAVSAATGAVSTANTAKATADAALATANSSGDAATHASNAAASADSAALYANGAQASAAAAQAAQTGAETAKAAAEAVGSSNDTIIASRINDTASATRSALNDSFGHKGDGVARFIARARNGENLTIGVLGDSIGAGYLLTTPETTRFGALVCADLHTRFGGTFTENNQAVASYTSFRSFVGLKVEAAVNANADLYIIEAFDKNDIGADMYGQYAPGYQLAQSSAAVERMIRVLREKVPKADILLISTNPYIAPDDTGNPYQQAKDAATKRLAALYGCEWVDGYAAFVALGSFSSKMADTTHPNEAGHRVLADAILAHIPNSERIARSASASPAKGYYNPEQVDTTVALTTGSASYGYMGASAPGTRYNGEFVWVNSGTWTTDGAGTDTTTTVGNYAEFTFYGTELTVQIDTSNTANAHIDVKVDGTVVAANQAMNLGKNNGLNFVTVAQGLTPGWHTVRLTLVSGALSINTAYALAGPHSPATPTVATVATVIGAESGIVSVDSAGAWTTVGTGTLTLPTGWQAATVSLLGNVSTQVTATTTTDRRIQADLLMNGTSVLPFQPAAIEQSVASGATRETNIPLLSGALITANATITVNLRVVSTDKTNVRSSGAMVKAVLTRTA